MTEHVMIVDDEPNMARAIARALNRSGYHCSTYGSAEAALEGFAVQGADLVLTDQRMPGMDGLTLMRRLHAQKAKLPVILMTAFGGIPNAVKAIKEGAFDYVTKPFDHTELRALVGRALKLGRLERENRELRRQLGHRSEREFIAESAAMRSVLELIDRAAHAPATVLIQGESGTGKEMIARRVHQQSPRVGQPFLAVNCKAFAEGVLESELFGHEKGAFSGAIARRLGCFERASGGTLFLDEIGETAPAFQAKLLRVLQEHEIIRVGGDHPQTIDVRLVAATNRDLKTQVAKGLFREDLFFRLNVIPVMLAPLRERIADILPLAQYFVTQQARNSGRNLTLSETAMDALRRHSWPGNVRELENAIVRAAILTHSGHIQPEDLLLETSFVGSKLSAGTPVTTLQEAMDRSARASIELALATCSNRRAEAAAMLGIERTTLYRFMKKLGMS